MRRWRPLGWLVLPLASVLLGAGSYPHAAQARPSAKTISVTFTVYEHRFTLSRPLRTVLPGTTIRFKLVNKRKPAYRFWLGPKLSKLVEVGKSATVTVTFRKQGYVTYSAFIPGKPYPFFLQTFGVLKPVVVTPEISSWKPLPLGGAPSRWSLLPSIAATPSGVVYITTEASVPGDLEMYQNVVTSLDARDKQGPVDVLAPALTSSHVTKPRMTAGPAGVAVLTGVTRWVTAPAGITTDGVVAWTHGSAGWALGDLLPGPTTGPGSAADDIGPQPVDSATWPDGTVYTLLAPSYSSQDLLLARGRGAAATYVRPSISGDCDATGGKLVSDGARLWIGWHQESGCTNPADVGYATQPVDPATGALGAPAYPPIPPGFSRPLVDVGDTFEEPVPIATRAGRGGVWIAYQLLRSANNRDGIRDVHQFLWHTGDAAAVDLGIVGNRNPRTDLLVAGVASLDATPSGRLWIGWRQLGRERYRRTSATGSTYEPGTWILADPKHVGTGPGYLAGPVTAAAGEALEVIMQTPELWHIRLGAGFVPPSEKK